MRSILLVALGGAVGSVVRFKLSDVVFQHTVEWRFPLSTILVNIVGCFIVGVLGGLVVKADLFSPEVRALLFTGILGGFTTFSAFGLEAFYLVRRGEYFVAGTYLVLSVVVGLLVLWLGFGAVPSRS